MERLEQRAGLLIRREIAAERAERQAMAIRRVNFLGAKDRHAARTLEAARAGLPAASDRGAEGRAMASRQSAVVSVQHGTNEEPEEVRRMLDSNPLMLMGLSPVQLQAADVLASTYRDARPAMVMPKGFGSGRQAGLRHLSHDEYLASRQAWHDYRRWLEVVEQRLGLQHATAVRDAVVMQEPAPAWRVREALDVLADYWKL